jgi:5-methylthioadenosine/S-adenosylhomocysteine deaminase
MGTSVGGELLRLPVGRIAPGYKADFVGVSLGDLSLQPSSPDLMLAHVVYAMQPTALARVVINGREVMRDGVLLTVPQTRIRTLVDAAQERFLQAFPRP